MAAHLARRAVHSKWKTLLREEKSAAGSEPLFPGVPVVGQPDELFARRGWLRGPVKFRQLSQAADPHQPTNLLFKLRALFGIQARAEVMACLLAFESGHPREMAERLAYFPRTLQTALNDMVCSGHVLTRREGHETRFWLRRDEWRFLLTWPARDGAGGPDFPRWVDWASLFAAIEAVWHFLDRSDLDGAAPAVQALELRACLDKLDPTFLRENVHIPTGASGAGFVAAVLNSFFLLLQ